jgi:MFS family permease
VTADDTAQRFDANEKNVLVYTGCAHALTHYTELAYPTLAVVYAVEVGLPLEEVLGWSLLGYMLLGFGALPAGYLADHFGCRRLVSGGLLLSGLAFILAGWAAPGWPIVACLALAGLGASTYHPAGMSLISRAVRARGTALGINGIYGNVGIALGPMVTGLLATQLGSRATFIITGAAILAVALATGLLNFDEPVRSEETQLAHDAHRSPRWRFACFALLCAAALFGGFNYRANSVVQPGLFAERIDFLHYGLATSFAISFGIVGQYIGGRLADRFPLAPAYFLFHLGSLPAVLLIPIAFDTPLLVAAAFFAFFSLGMQPLENSLYAQLTPERWRATAYGLKFTMTFGVGASAVAMVEWVKPGGGFVGVYHVVAFVVGGILAATLGLAILLRGRMSTPLPAPVARARGNN